MRALVVCAIVAAATAAFATDPGWTERAARATLGIVGRVESRESRWEGGAIYSYSEVVVRTAFRGAPGRSVVVRQQGGVVDGMGQRVSHVRLLRPGETVLLFLVREGADWRPVRGGVNPVSVDTAGVETVGGQPLSEIVRSLENRP